MSRHLSIFHVADNLAKILKPLVFLELVAALACSLSRWRLVSVKTVNSILIETVSLDRLHIFREFRITRSYGRRNFDILALVKPISASFLGTQNSLCTSSYIRAILKTLVSFEARISQLWDSRFTRSCKTVIFKFLNSFERI